MNILCVDDEKLAVKLLKELCTEINNTFNVHCFTNPIEAVEFAASNVIDVALLDVDMPEMSGIELAKKLKSYNPRINIIMVTAYSQYSIDAFEIDASGYLTKPISTDKLKHQLEVLRFPLEGSSLNKIEINTEGSFKIFVNGRMPRFKYSKTLDLLSFLVEQNGAFCSNTDIEHALWDDNVDHYEYVKSLKKDLRSGLTEVGVEEIILSSHGRIAIKMSVLNNDY